MRAPEEFCAAIRAKYSEEFSLHDDVAAVVEKAIVQPRRLADMVPRAADFLMFQAHKAHESVYFLAERALVEDAATIVRRLLEIAVQAVYMIGDSDLEVRKERAGRYLAHLWAQIPDVWRMKAPVKERTAWEAIYEAHRHLLPAKRKSWGPDFRTMFQEIGGAEAYEHDYSLLSGIAHGASPGLVREYNLRSDTYVDSVLVVASRYCLAVTDQWNDIFRLIDPGQLNGLVTRATQFFSGKKASRAPSPGGST